MDVFWRWIGNLYNTKKCLNLHSVARHIRRIQHFFIVCSTIASWSRSMWCWCSLPCEREGIRVRAINKNSTTYATKRCIFLYSFYGVMLHHMPSHSWSRSNPQSVLAPFATHNPQAQNQYTHLWHEENGLWCCKEKNAKAKECAEKAPTKDFFGMMVHEFCAFSAHQLCCVG